MDLTSTITWNMSPSSLRLWSSLLVSPYTPSRSRLMTEGLGKKGKTIIYYIRMKRWYWCHTLSAIYSFLSAVIIVLLSTLFLFYAYTAYYYGRITPEPEEVIYYMDDIITMNDLFNIPPPPNRLSSSIGEISQRLSNPVSRAFALQTKLTKSGAPPAPPKASEIELKNRDHSYL